MTWCEIALLTWAGVATLAALIFLVNWRFECRYRQEQLESWTRTCNEKVVVEAEVKRLRERWDILLKAMNPGHGA